MNKRLFVILGILGVLFCAVLFLSRHEIKQKYIFLKQKFSSSPVNIISTSTSSSLKIIFLDIGQGDASLINFPDGTQMLVDCSIDARILEALGRNMSPFDRTIEYLLITHPDQDHYGGCVDVMKRFEIKHIVYTGYDKEGSAYFDEFMNMIKQENAQYHQIDQEQTWQVASTTLHFLYPDGPLQNHEVLKNTKKKSPTNNTSIVFLLSYGDEDILFTGDAEFEIEEYVLKKYSTELDIEILKVGHHGSSGSSSDAFLKITTPEHAIISSGKNNSYGHPTARVLKRLERVKSEVWRTDQIGDIILYINQDSVYVENP